MVESQSDPAERVLLTRGFELGYVIPLHLKEEFLRYKAVLNLRNIHCNLCTLDNLTAKTFDRNETSKLLNSWMKWVERGNDLSTYPFTTDKSSMVVYNRLIKNYGNAIP